MPRQNEKPRITVNTTVSARIVKKLRQNVTSKERADSRWRVITPAELHSKVTKTIKETARACDIDEFGMRGLTEQCRRGRRQSAEYTRLRRDAGHALLRCSSEHRW